MTLTEAATELGLDSSTLRRQIARGALRARKVGPVWTVTPRELDRYRAEHLGRRGRPPATPQLDEAGRAAWLESSRAMTTAKASALELVREHAAGRHGATVDGCPVCAFVEH